MGHRMVLGYGDGLTIFLKDHVKRQQAESPLHDVATNFQFVEPLSVSRHCPTNPTRSTVPRRTSLKTCSTIVARRSEANQRGPASPPIQGQWLRSAVGTAGGWGLSEGCLRVCSLDHVQRPTG